MNIEIKLNELQFGESDKYLLVKQIPIGFGGQVTKRLDGLALGIATNRKVIFEYDDDPPYSKTFLPMSNKDAKIFDWKNANSIDFNLNQADEILILDENTSPVREISGDFKSVIVDKIKNKIGINKLESKDVDGEIFLWMAIHEDVRNYVDEQVKRLEVDQDTLGVHLRRGDKSVETAYVPAVVVNEKIKLIYEKWKFKKIFIASDDPDAYEEIDAPVGVMKIFDKLENRYNNANHKMLRANPDLSRQETLTAYKNIFLLSCCGGIVGQDNAHFATVAAGVISSKKIFENNNRLILIDGKIRENNSKLVLYLFNVKRLVRKIGKKIYFFLRDIRKV